MITVGELIKDLKRFNKDLNVEIEDLDGATIENFTVEEAFGTLILKSFE